jgi:hypothetical protein
MNKAPNKGGKRRNKVRGPKFELEGQNPKWVPKGQRNKSCYKTLPINFMKHIRKKKG